MGPRPMVFVNDGKPLNDSPIVATVPGVPANTQPKEMIAIAEAVAHIAQAIEKAAEEQKASKSKGNCPKCGKHYEKGLHLHVRHCKA